MAGSPLAFPLTRGEASAREPENAVLHLTRTVVTLGSSVGVQSALGVVFALTAARMFGASASGADLTMIAVARALAAVVQLNMPAVVHRLLPTLQNPARFVMRTYAITTALAVVAALLVVFVGGQYSDVVHELVERPFYAVFFVVAVASWNVFALQDIVLATLRLGRVVLIRSVTYGVAAIGCLFVMRASGFDRPILLAFFAPVLPLAVVVSWFVFRRAIPADLELGVRRRKLDVRRESGLIIGDICMSTVELLVRALTPVLVADWLGADIAAGYAIASAVGFSMGDLFASVQRSLATELSRYPEQRSHLVRRSLKLIGIGLVPSALLLAIAAPVVLRIFGEDFVGATPFLRVLLLSLIPGSLTNVALTVARAQRSIKVTVGSLVVAHGIAIAIILLFLGDHGVVVVGVAYLLGWTAAMVPSWIFLARQQTGRQPTTNTALSVEVG
jgi:O-antigen/teichoic acid export membrane protein